MVESDEYESESSLPSLLANLVLAGVVLVAVVVVVVVVPVAVVVLVLSLGLGGRPELAELPSSAIHGGLILLVVLLRFRLLSLLGLLPGVLRSLFRCVFETTARLIKFVTMNSEFVLYKFIQTDTYTTLATLPVSIGLIGRNLALRRTSSRYVVVLDTFRGICKLYYLANSSYAFCRVAIDHT